MTAKHPDVVVLGAGVAGLCTAYYLCKAGASVLVLERDSPGSHSSGFAYGILNLYLVQESHPPQVRPLARESVRLHSELSRTLPQESGVDYGFQQYDDLFLARTDEDMENLRQRFEALEPEEGYASRWVDDQEARAIEPRIADGFAGGLLSRGMAQVEPYRFSLALAQAVERLGGSVRTATAVGLRWSKGHVAAVETASREVPCDRVIFAMGPWSSEASDWLGTPLDVRPMRGQILKFRLEGDPIACFVHPVSEGSLMTRYDGLVWAPGMFEDAGFDENPTVEARDFIMSRSVDLVPSLIDSELVQHTACLRPYSRDNLPLLGEVPGAGGCYVATGAGTQGICMAPAFGKTLSELLTTGRTGLEISDFDPGRFAGTETPFAEP